MATTLEIALTQLGVREPSGDANGGIPAERYNRGQRLPWCASFILYCNTQSDDPKYARTEKEWWTMRSVQAFEDEMKERGWWIPASMDAASGDLVFFGTRGGSDHSSIGRHIGIVERVEPVGTINPAQVIHTIEGNLGDSVKRATHDGRLHSVQQRITGFARFP